MSSLTKKIKWRTQELEIKVVFSGHTVLNSRVRIWIEAHAPPIMMCWHHWNPIICLSPSNKMEHEFFQWPLSTCSGLEKVMDFLMAPSPFTIFRHSAQPNPQGWKKNQSRATISDKLVQAYSLNSPTESEVAWGQGKHFHIFLSMNFLGWQIPLSKYFKKQWGNSASFLTEGKLWAKQGVMCSFGNNDHMVWIFKIVRELWVS